MTSKISLLACSLLFVLSCTNPPAEEDQLQSLQLDGQSIFKTVFFSLGEVAKDIPTFEDNLTILEEASAEDPAFMASYIASVDNYVEQLEEIQPAYFDQLRNAVYSQDFLEIKKAMEYGDLLLLPTIVMSSMEDIDDKKLKNQLEALNMEATDFQNETELRDLSQNLISILSGYETGLTDEAVNNGRCFFFAAAVAVTFAAVGNFVVAVNVVYAGNLNWEVNWQIPLQDGGGIDYGSYMGEQLIKEISQAFN